MRACLFERTSNTGQRSPSSHAPHGTTQSPARSSVFSLGDLATRRVDRLSAGQRQRVRLALTFLHKPTLVLLDEPQNSLDDEGLELLNDVIGEMTLSGATAICCSPNRDKINSPNDVYELRDGRLVHQ